VVENKVLRRTFALMREAVAAGWRKLQSEKFHNFIPFTEC
jgi:hypothetical protein